MEHQEEQDNYAIVPNPGHVLGGIDDLIREILIRIPVYSLQDMRLMSMDWRAIIDDRNFQDEHATLKLPLNYASGIHFEDESGMIETRSLLDHLVPDLNFIRGVNRTLELVNSCNGFILLQTDKIYIVCNPSIADYIEVQSPAVGAVYPHTFLKFDPCVNEAFYIYGFFNNNVGIYDSDRREWSHVDFNDFVYRRIIEFMFTQGNVYWRGKLYFADVAKDAIYSIACDFKRTSLREHSFPPRRTDRMSFAKILKYFGESCNRLILIYCRRTPTSPMCDIWEFDSLQQWKLIHSFNLNAVESFFPEIKVEGEDGYSYFNYNIAYAFFEHNQTSPTLLLHVESIMISFCTSTLACREVGSGIHNFVPFIGSFARINPRIDVERDSSSDSETESDSDSSSDSETESSESDSDSDTSSSDVSSSSEDRRKKRKRHSKRDRYKRGKKKDKRRDRKRRRRDKKFKCNSKRSRSPTPRRPKSMSVSLIRSLTPKRIVKQTSLSPTIRRRESLSGSPMSSRSPVRSPSRSPIRTEPRRSITRCPPPPRRSSPLARRSISRSPVRSSRRSTNRSSGRAANRSVSRSPFRVPGRNRRRSYSRSLVRGRVRSPVAERGGRSVSRSPSADGSPKRIRRGRGFSQRLSYARRYHSPERSPARSYHFGSRSERDRYTSYRRSPRRHRSPARERTPPRYRSRRSTTRSPSASRSPIRYRNRRFSRSRSPIETATTRHRSSPRLDRKRSPPPSRSVSRSSSLSRSPKRAASKYKSRSPSASPLPPNKGLVSYDEDNSPDSPGR